MKKITLGYTQDLDSIRIVKGVLEPMCKLGANNLLLHNIFSKGYVLSDFIATLKKLIFNNSGVKANIRLSLGSAPFEELTPERIAALPEKFRADATRINRYPPNNMQYIIDLVNAIEVAGLKPYVSYDLWHEPDSPKYFWGTENEFDNKDTDKYSTLLDDSTRDKIYFGNFTSGLITNGKNDYLTIMQLLASDFNVSFSFYWHSAAHGWFDFDNNTFPSKAANVAISEYNLHVGSGTAAYDEINSDLWMVYMVKFLQNIVKYNWPVNEIFFFSLIDANESDEKGKHGAWEKTKSGGYMYRHSGKLQIDLMNILRQHDGTFGYTVTPSGIRGVSKEIIITNNTYEIK